MLIVQLLWQAANPPTGAFTARAAGRVKWRNSDRASSIKPIVLFGSSRMSFLGELQRRNVVRVAIAYLVASWVLIEVSATLEDTLHLPDWADSLFAFFLILGFPLALLFSWVFEITPEGIQRESRLREDSVNRQATASRLNRLTVFLMVIALGYFAIDRLAIHQAVSDRDAVETVAMVEEPVTAARVTASAEPSIAVLPFVNMSSDSEQDYFSDGLTEELLNLLAGIEGLQVSARTSSFYYKNKLEDMQLSDVAAQLNVGHILEGSVRKNRNQLRITAQLIDASSGFHLWSETWDRSLDDIFQIQDEIARAVVDNLRVQLLGDSPNARVVKSDALDLTLRGRYLFNRRAPGDLEKAMAAFEQALAIDANVAEAWVGLAPLYLWLFDPPRLEDAEQAIDRALAIDPDNAEAWVRRGSILWTKGDWRAGRASAAKALEFDPDNPLALTVNAALTRKDGDLEGAIELVRKANRADPLHVVNRNFMAGLLMDAEDYSAAEQALVEAEQLFPDMRKESLPRVRLSLLTNQPERALEELQDVTPGGPGTNGGNAVLKYQAMAYHRLGQVEASDEAMRALKAENGTSFPIDVAMALAWRGDLDEALHYLSLGVPMVKLYGVGDLLVPELAALHADPRWPGLLAAYRAEKEFSAVD